MGEGGEEVAVGEGVGDEGEVWGEAEAELDRLIIIIIYHDCNNNNYLLFIPSFV